MGDVEPSEAVAERAAAQRIFRGNVAVASIISVGILVIVVCVLASYVHDRPLRFYTRDAAATTERHYLLGFVSNAGLVFWSAAAAVSLLTAFATRVRRSFFVFAGLFSLLLLTDDTILLHEEVLFIQLKLSEHYMYALYAILGTVLVVRHPEMLTGAGRGLFFTAFILFAMSIGIDLTTKLGSPTQIEDLPKFMGITLWFAYLFDQSLRTLTPLTRR